MWLNSSSTKRKKQASKSARVVNAFLLNNWMCDVNMIENVYFCSGYYGYNFFLEKKYRLLFPVTIENNQKSVISMTIFTTILFFTIFEKINCATFT